MNTLTANEIADQRALSLARRFHEEFVPPLIKTTDLAAMPALYSRGGGKVRPLASGRSRAMVWEKETSDLSSVWVEAGATQYVPIFSDFVEEFYDARIKKFAPTFDVDHLFNRARVPDQHYVRIELVRRGINRSHGAGFEKRDTKSTISLANRDKEQQSLTFVSFLKIAGLAVPRSMDDSARLDPVFDYFYTHGWQSREIRHGIETLLLKSTWDR